MRGFSCSSCREREKEREREADNHEISSFRLHVCVRKNTIFPLLLRNKIYFQPGKDSWAGGEAFFGNERVAVQRNILQVCACVPLFLAILGLGQRGGVKNDEVTLKFDYSFCFAAIII